MTWGLPRRRLDQVRQPATAATAPGSTSVVRARYVIVFGTGDGVFVYASGTTPALGNPPIAWMGGNGEDPYGNALPSTSGVLSSGSFQAGNMVINANALLIYSSTPALGNLIASMAYVGGTDPHGNAYLAGTTSYFATGGGYQASQVFGGAFAFQISTSYAGPYTEYGSIDNGIFGSGTSVQFNLINAVAFVFVGPLQATSGTPANPTLITTDTWHTLSLQNSWTGVLQYKLEPNNRVSIRSQGTLGVGTRTTGTLVATLPTSPFNYAPAFQVDLPFNVTSNSSGAASINSPFLRVATNGQMTIENISTQVATNGSIDESFPLD
jgi:hypothetical protein